MVEKIKNIATGLDKKKLKSLAADTIITIVMPAGFLYGAYKLCNWVKNKKSTKTKEAAK